MRKIRIFEHTSLDGVIAPGGPQEDTEFGRGGWTTPYRSPAGAQTLAEVQGRGYDLLLGRRTYDLWASYWPTVTTGPFAEGLNGARKYVVTHRAEGLTWGPAQPLGLGADLAATLRQLKETDGPDLILWGSSTVTPVLFEHGLIEEVVLIVYPVLLGPGKRFFSDHAHPRELALVSSEATSTGALLNTYRYVGALPAKAT